MRQIFCYRPPLRSKILTFPLRDVSHVLEVFLERCIFGINIIKQQGSVKYFVNVIHQSYKTCILQVMIKYYKHCPHFMALLGIWYCLSTHGMTSFSLNYYTSNAFISEIQCVLLTIFFCLGWLPWIPRFSVIIRTTFTH